jgi:hypothetical protein
MDKLVDLQTLNQESIDQALEALPDKHTALELGQAIYRCRSLPWQDRWRAGREILPYETPRLGITAVVSEQDFATLLDRRLARIAEMKMIEARPNNGGETPKPTNAAEVSRGAEVDARLQPRVPDRRWRRV